MRKWMISTILTALLLAAPGGSRAADCSLDGNGWLKLDPKARLGYVTGIYDGMRLGVKYGPFLVFDDSCTAKYKESWDRVYGKQFVDLDMTVLRDGLDRFYQDPRNREICGFKAVDIVCRQLKKFDPSATEALLDEYRRKVR